jgi:tetratricopeptide (TPR) repeat protein
MRKSGSKLGLERLSSWNRSALKGRDRGTGESGYPLGRGRAPRRKTNVGSSPCGETRYGGRRGFQPPHNARGINTGFSPGGTNSSDLNRNPEDSRSSFSPRGNTFLRYAIRISALGLALWCFLPLAIQAQSGGENDEAKYAAAGQQAMATGDFATARSNFEQLVKLDPEVAEVHATLAVICFKQRDYERAVREVRTAQKLKPSLPKLDSLLGMALAELGQFTEALPHLEKGFKQTTDAEVRRMCGLQLLRAYTGLSRDDDAVETALKLNKLYPDDPEILYHTGRIYGNFAYVVMEKLHDKAPNSVWMLQAQGEANESQKAYDAAIVAFNHVLQLDPRRPGIHYRLGRVYLARFRDGQKAEDRDAAKREFMAELGIDYGNGNARYELANMQAELGNLEEARKQFEQVLEHFPDFEAALVGLGGVCLKGEKPEQAVAPLERATKLSPDDEVAWYRLAQAERAAGNKEAQQKALAAFKKIHSTTPGTLRKSNESEEITPQQIGADANP